MNIRRLTDRWRKNEGEDHPNNNDQEDIKVQDEPLQAQKIHFLGDE